MNESKPLQMLLSLFFFVVVGSQLFGAIGDMAAKRKIEQEKSALKLLEPTEVFEYIYFIPNKMRIGHGKPFYWRAERDVKRPLKQMRWEEEILCDSLDTDGIVWAFEESFVSLSNKVKLGVSGGGKFKSKKDGITLLAPEYDALCKITSDAVGIAKHGVEFRLTLGPVYVYVGEYPAIDDLMLMQ